MLVRETLKEGSQGDLIEEEGCLVEVVPSSGLVLAQVDDDALDGLDAKLNLQHLSVAVVGVLRQLLLCHLDQCLKESK